MDKMSVSYAKTMTLLDADDLEKASKEYKAGFNQEVKKLYSESAKVYPLRYSKVKDWCAWTKVLYITSRKTEIALDKGKKELALKNLAALRKHFYSLHVETKTEKASDYIYAFRDKANADQLEPAKLKSLYDLLLTAPPSGAAAKAQEKFDEARDAWSAQIEPLLQDDKIEEAEVAVLRSAAEDLYGKYGMVLE